MLDILFLICVLGGGGIGIYVALNPERAAADHRAKGGTGVFADPAKVRMIGIASALVAATVFILRTFVVA